MKRKNEETKGEEKASARTHLQHEEAWKNYVVEKKKSATVKK